MESEVERKWKMAEKVPLQGDGGGPDRRGNDAMPPSTTRAVPRGQWDDRDLGGQEGHRGK